jgi:hypothetical protein
MVQIRRGRKTQYYKETKINFFGPNSSIGKLLEANRETLKLLKEEERNYGYIKKVFYSLWKRRNP